MANTTHHEQVRPGAPGPRADEIHVHQRGKRGSGMWPWRLLALALGLIVLLAFLATRREEARLAAATTCDPATLTFAAGSSTFSKTDRVQLHKLATCLKQNSARKMRLEGRAAPQEGAVLARSRADAVGRELRSLGVPGSQFSVGIAGFVCSENTNACAERNRTVSATPLRRE